MKVRVHILTALLLTASTIACAQGDSVPLRYEEHQVKAAFLYNFAQFTEWPKTKFDDSNEIIIGLLGGHQFENAFDPVKDKSVRDKRLIIKDLGRFRQSFAQDDAGKLELANYIEQLRKCHLLFICEAERDNFRAILDAVKGYGVLTVGETEDFLEFGGIITFIPGTEKPVFEVNRAVCEREGLKISSKVLRLARKVIGDKDSDLGKDK